MGKDTIVDDALTRDDEGGNKNFRKLQIRVNSTNSEQSVIHDQKQWTLVYFKRCTRVDDIY